MTGLNIRSWWFKICSYSIRLFPLLNSSRRTKEYVDKLYLAKRKFIKYIILEILSVTNILFISSSRYIHLYAIWWDRSNYSENLRANEVYTTNKMPKKHEREFWFTRRRETLASGSIAVYVTWTWTSKVLCDLWDRETG